MMADKASFEFQGLRALGERMRSLSKEVNQKLAYRAVLSAAALIKKEAKANLIKNPSVDSFALYKSVVTKRNKKTRLTAQYDVGVSNELIKKFAVKKAGRKNSPYYRAVAIEYGNSHQAPEPYLRPALEQNKLEATQRMAKSLRTGIDRATL